MTARYRKLTPTDGWAVWALTDAWAVCEDCGGVVADKEAHTRYHSIESGWAWALAVLKTAHIAAHTHDKFDVPERIDSRKFDSWSSDALSDFIQSLDAGLAATASNPVTPPELAQYFHEAYERLAPEFGYQTREASAKPWAEVPEENRRLMEAVALQVLLHFFPDRTAVAAGPPVRE